MKRQLKKLSESGDLDREVMAPKPKASEMAPKVKAKAKPGPQPGTLVPRYSEPDHKVVEENVASAPTRSVYLGELCYEDGVPVKKIKN